MDQEKCFDRIDHEFVYKVLGRFGFGGGFIKWVRTFYSGVNSRVLINGEWGDLIQIGRGLRQGDAPSSLLYVAVVEVLACQIRGNRWIEGIKMGRAEKKIGGYANDTQGFVTSVESLGDFMGEVALYERASGSKLNRDKTEGLWLGTWRGRQDKPYGLNWTIAAGFIDYSNL